MKYNYAFIRLDTNVDLDLAIGTVGYNFFSKTRKAEQQTILTYTHSNNTFELTSVSCAINMGKENASYDLDRAPIILSGSPIVNIIDNYIVVKGIHGNSAQSSAVGLCVNLTYKIEMNRMKWLQRKFGSLWLCTFYFIQRHRKKTTKRVLSC
jgi:hypothetical protein